MLSSSQHEIPTAEIIKNGLHSRIENLQKEVAVFETHNQLSTSFMELLSTHVKTPVHTDSSLMTLWQDLLRRIHKDGTKLSKSTKELLVTFKYLVAPSQYGAEGLLRVLAGAVFNSQSSLNIGSAPQLRAQLITKIVSVKFASYDINLIVKHMRPSYHELAARFHQSLQKFHELLERSEIDKKLFSLLTKQDVTREFKLADENLEKAKRLMTCNDRELLGHLEGQDAVILELMKDPKCKQSIEERLLSLFLSIPLDVKKLPEFATACNSLNRFRHKYHFSLDFYNQLFVKVQAILMWGDKTYDMAKFYSDFLINILTTHREKISIPFSEEMTRTGFNTYQHTLNLIIEQIIESRFKPMKSKAQTVQTDLLSKIKNMMDNPSELLKIFHLSSSQEGSPFENMDPHNLFAPVWEYLLKKIKDDMSKDKQKLSRETCELFIILVEAVLALQKNEDEKAAHILVVGISICKASVTIGEGNRAKLLQDLLKIKPAKKSDLDSIVRSFSDCQTASMQSLRLHFDAFVLGIKNTAMWNIFETFTKTNLDQEAPILTSQTDCELKPISRAPLSTNHEIKTVSAAPVVSKKEPVRSRDDEVKLLATAAENEFAKLLSTQDSKADDAFAISFSARTHQKTELPSLSPFVILWKDLLHRIKKDGSSLTNPTQELITSFKFLTTQREPQNDIARLIACAYHNAQSSLNFINGQKRAKLILAIIDVTALNYSIYSLAHFLTSNYKTHALAFQESLNLFMQFLNESPHDKDLFEILTKSKLNPTVEKYKSLDSDSPKLMPRSAFFGLTPFMGPGPSQLSRSLTR